MKKGLILVVLMPLLLVGCAKKEENRIIASLDAMSPTVTSPIINEGTTTAAIQENTNPTTRRVTTKANNLYIEIETEKKEKHKYTFVYKTFDECQAKGNEFLPMLQKLHPEIIKSDCKYLKDDNNNRYWGVLFQTCNDPSKICNFYY